jgi:hypothetical protein
VPLLKVDDGFKDKFFPSFRSAQERFASSSRFISGGNYFNHRFPVGGEMERSRKCSSFSRG